ncbi:hypothetical protein [Shimazuella kribbensis]|uniref:hypothetical protein n=1 Tax=Shimazuella kribbensis TaxID=139808 RepID=UPI00041ED58F|nr:hypothetical protein [Shimazuella kribbensis]
MQQSDALFNWLQIQIVWDARPSDISAKDTVVFFETLLLEDYEIKELKMELRNQEYCISYKQEGKEHKVSFPKEQAEKLLKDITEEPKYNTCL